MPDRRSCSKPPLGDYGPSSDRKVSTAKFVLSMGAALVSAMLLSSPSARAESFPTKPVTVIVPIAPGGPTDIVARLVAKELQTKLGQPVVVENRPGASGVVGANVVISAPADGYTLMFYGAGATFSKAFFKEPAIDFRKQFRAVAQVVQTPLVLFASTKAPFDDFSGFLKFAQENPEFNLGMPGNAPSLMFAAAFEKVDPPLKPTVVVYKGSSETTQALLAGDMLVNFENPAAHLPLVKDGRARALVVSSAERLAHFPDTPTFKEAGIDFTQVGNQGFFVRRETSDEKVAILNAAVNAVLADAALRQRISEVTTGSVTPATVEIYQAFSDNEIRIYEETAEKLGLVPQQ